MSDTPRQCRCQDCLAHGAGAYQLHAEVRIAALEARVVDLGTRIDSAFDLLLLATQRLGAARYVASACQSSADVLTKPHG
jgi:hypothetical protein